MRGLGLAMAVLLMATPLGAQPNSRPAPPPAEQLAAPGRPGWMIDAANGCWVWNPNPRPGETGTWEGACPRGPAEGRGRSELRWTEQGTPRVATYVGTLRAGRMEGSGLLDWGDGNRYAGEWREDRPHGRGISLFPNGDRYEGLYWQGRRHGHGTYSNPNGHRYEGEFRNGHRHGRGVFTWPGGDRYDGEWRDGRENGRGIETWPDGRRFEGQYRDGRPDGPGILTTPTASFEGIWVSGCFRDEAGRRAVVRRRLDECR